MEYIGSRFQKSNFHSLPPLTLLCQQENSPSDNDQQLEEWREIIHTGGRAISNRCNRSLGLFWLGWKNNNNNSVSTAVKITRTTETVEKLDLVTQRMKLILLNSAGHPKDSFIRQIEKIRQYLKKNGRAVAAHTVVYQLISNIQIDCVKSLFTTVLILYFFLCLMVCLFVFVFLM